MTFTVEIPDASTVVSLTVIRETFLRTEVMTKNFQPKDGDRIVVEFPQQEVKNT